MQAATSPADFWQGLCQHWASFGVQVPPMLAQQHVASMSEAQALVWQMLDGTAAGVCGSGHSVVAGVSRRPMLKRPADGAGHQGSSGGASDSIASGGGSDGAGSGDAWRLPGYLSYMTGAKIAQVDATRHR